MIVSTCLVSQENKFSLVANNVETSLHATSLTILELAVMKDIKQTLLFNFFFFNTGFYSIIGMTLI